MNDNHYKINNRILLGGSTKIGLTISGMTCAHCATTIKKTGKKK
jgi:hypothetical protein